MLSVFEHSLFSGNFEDMCADQTSYELLKGGGGVEDKNERERGGEKERERD